MAFFSNTAISSPLGTSPQQVGLGAQRPDVPIVSPPSDTVTSLNFTPVQNANFLVSTAWSGQVLCWDVALQGSPATGLTPASQPKAAIQHDMSLDSDWHHDGSKVVTCGCDRAVKIWDLATNQQQQIGTHDAPVRHVAFLHPSLGNGSIIASGGWDKKLKYWDLRMATAAGEVALEGKVYAMDTREQLLVVGTSEQANPMAANPATPKPPNDRMRKIYCFNLQGNHTTPFKSEASPLQYQTRCVAAFPGNAGYLVGSIEGRVGVQNFDGMHPDKQPSYTFKCHRRTLDASGNVVLGNTKTVGYGRKDAYDEVYSVNIVKFHQAGTFATAGSDGVYAFWDKDEKARLVKPPASVGKAITAGGYNSTGSVFAYAAGYDWGQGCQYHDPSHQANAPQILLHALEGKEYQRKAKGKR